MLCGYFSDYVTTMKQIVSINFEKIQLHNMLERINCLKLLINFREVIMNIVMNIYPNNCMNHRNANVGFLEVVVFIQPVYNE